MQTQHALSLYSACRRRRRNYVCSSSSRSSKTSRKGSKNCPRGRPTRIYSKNRIKPAEKRAAIACVCVYVLPSPLFFNSFMSGRTKSSSLLFLSFFFISAEKEIPPSPLSRDSFEVLSTFAIFFPSSRLFFCVKELQTLREEKEEEASEKKMNCICCKPAFFFFVPNYLSRKNVPRW